MESEIKLEREVRQHYKPIKISDLYPKKNGKNGNIFGVVKTNTN